MITAITVNSGKTYHRPRRPSFSRLLLLFPCRLRILRLRSLIARFVWHRHKRKEEARIQTTTSGDRKDQARSVRPLLKQSRLPLQNCISRLRRLSLKGGRLKLALIAENSPLLPPLGVRAVFQSLDGMHVFIQMYVGMREPVAHPHACFRKPPRGLSLERAVGGPSEFRLPVEDTMTFSSIGTAFPGRGEGSEPVARIMFAVSSNFFSPSAGVTTTWVASASLPSP